MRRSSPVGSARSVGLAALTVGLALALIGCGGSNADSDPEPSGGSGGGRPGLRLDQAQIVGTHNSYHRRPFPPVWRQLQESVPAIAAEIDYEHPPLPDQLNRGVRHIELDILDDPAGNLYAPPPGETYPNLPTDPVMRRPGFKVLHQAGVDTNSNCLTLEICLRQVRDWSSAHPGHVPIAVMLQSKDPAFGADRLRRLEATIESVFPRRQLLTPDDVRGEAPTLGAAVRARGWPEIDRVRGRIWLFMPGAQYRTTVLARDPGLRDALVFTASTPGATDAAFAMVDDPVADGDLVTAAVRAGMIVRTRADADTYEARRNETGRRRTALAGGAQLISTDYPWPDPRFGTGYVVRIPGGTPGRCNPVTAPPGCRPEDVEDPARLAPTPG